VYADILRDRALTVDQFAIQMGQGPDEIAGLLQGRATITLATARQLEQVLGPSVEFWMSRDFQYREDLAKLQSVDEGEWLSELPLSDMIRFGWLDSVPHPSDETAACLRFFGVPDVHTWRALYANVSEMAVFRSSSSFDSRPGAVAAWLRRGEIEGTEIACAVWDAKTFKQLLPRLRSLTRRKDPRDFVPQLQKVCAAVGIAVVVVRAPAGCRASGATRFLSPSKALLQLSFRHLSDDQFWFTFFHEAGHLLLHGMDGFFVEGIGAPNTGNPT
jgi:HTH-type transcriptional regulator/antitoxin HigA